MANGNGFSAPVAGGSSSAPLKAIIFDLDGVITATVDLHYQSWKKALEPYGIEWTRVQNDALRSLTRRESLNRILDGRRLPLHDQQSILDAKNDHYLQSVDNLSTADLLPGVNRLLDEIEAANLHTAVASASRNTRQVLERLGVGRRIEAVVDANDVPVSKPAPDVYLHAAAALNLESGDCLALDDSPAGVQSALSAGMCAVGVGALTNGSDALDVFESLENVHLHHLISVFRLWKRCLHAGNVLE